jgi:hypothetical protein
MCTVSWFHDAAGYQLFCNRDERRTRAEALPPRLQVSGNVRYVSPLDGDCGGTWVAVNELGISICLLNGPRIEASPKEPLSRGYLIPYAIAADSAFAAVRRFRQIDLARFHPFMAIVLEPDSSSILALWDGNRFMVIPNADGYVPLVSSSFDTQAVAECRRREFAHRRHAAGVIDARLLQEFHSSHGNGASAHSPCMHRRDAETVSFTQVVVSDASVQFTYNPTAPCVPSLGQTLTLARRRLARSTPCIRSFSSHLLRSCRKT